MFLGLEVLTRPCKDRLVIVNGNDLSTRKPVYYGLGQGIIERDMLDIQVGEVT